MRVQEGNKMWEWIMWGFFLGVKVFGAAAGLVLALVSVFLLAILALAFFLELYSGLCEWAANLLRRLSK